MKFSVTLTIDELSVIIKLMNQEGLIGLPEEPSTTQSGMQITPQMRAYGAVCGMRSLRARELAIVTEQGVLQLREDLDKNLAVCARAHQAFVINRVFEGDTGAERVVLYSANGAAVAMLNPSPALYTFVALQHRPAMFDQLVIACLGKRVIEAVDSYALTVPHQALANAREAAARSNLPAAQIAVATSGNSPQAAAALARTLCEPHTLTIIHAVEQLSASQVKTQEFTVVCGSDRAWLMFKTKDHVDTARTSFSVTSINNTQLRGLMQTLFATAV